MRALALAGGVGGAKLVVGLAHCLTPDELVVAVNTGDDEEFHGLHVSPDLDTMMYTLAGLSNPEAGWGLNGDTFTALAMLRQYGADTWFNLGDRDLATHIRRTQLLKQGLALSEVTAELCAALGVNHRIVPMSDQPVRTVLETSDGRLSMQEYFVRERAQPEVSAVHYLGSGDAIPSPGLDEALALARILVICPSNPALSVQPIVEVSGMKERLASFSGLRVAVSPIVGNDAVRGPAGRIMAGIGQEVSVVGVARAYREFCDVLVIDRQDDGLASAVAEAGVRPVVTNTIMNSLQDRIDLAKTVLSLDQQPG
ncbi:MAG: 2-phospho-L-lactate transferase [Chloroflexi bacterium]|nr:2-phospho-L-lactate transferase [Chloroflexota bacterium]MYE39200.1 2-phospho-L-lactate transferase [Chloroflexota bacterium]